MAQLMALAHDYFVCFALELQFGHIVLNINLILLGFDVKTRA
jgi:hypothetical protein